MALPTRVHRGFVDPLDVIGNEFDNVLGRFFGQQGNGGNRAAIAPFGVDIREDVNHLYIEADMPGFTKDEVDVTLENNTLTLSAEHKEQQQKKDDANKGQQWLLNERRYARVLRSFTLPDTVDESKVDAKLENGVLTIQLYKRPEVKPRKIQVG